MSCPGFVRRPCQNACSAEQNLVTFHICYPETVPYTIFVLLRTGFTALEACPLYNQWRLWRSCCAPHRSLLSYRQVTRSSQPPSPARSQLRRPRKDVQTASATFSGKKPRIFACMSHQMVFTTPKTLIRPRRETATRLQQFR